MDTPGFGENNPTVTSVAERALKLGSAYVYVVNTGTVSDTVDAMYYNQLKQEDEGKCGTLQCVVTHSLKAKH